MMQRRALLRGMVLAAGALASPAFAQDAYPSRPIRLIVPFAPGGLNDATARLWAERVKADLGAALVVDNRGGAGGTIGAIEAARAKPDGYTIFLGSSTTQVLNPALTARPAYDPLKDFTAVSIFAAATGTIAVHPSVPAKTLMELIAHIKANPGKLSYGSAGTGSNSHLTGELFKYLAGGLDITHVSYRGAGPAVADLLGGHILVGSPHMTAQLLDLHNSGKIRILAAASAERLQGAPEIPTGTEAGLPGLVATTFNGILAPAGTPPEFVARIDAATQKAMQDPEFRSALIKAGFEPLRNVGGAAADRYIADEVARLTPVVKAIGFKLE
jgi:tripartite-type tricarboxylate transporter receptor subunit TctC